MRGLGSRRWLWVILPLALPACGGERGDAEGKEPSKEPASPTKADDGKAAAELSQLALEARAALDAGDLREASRLIGRGLALSSSGGAALDRPRGGFLRLRGDVARDEGRMIDARRDYADAMAIFRVEGIDPGRFEVLVSEAELEEVQGDYAAEERELSEAETLLPKVTDETLRGAYLRQLGRLAFVRAKYKEACASYGEAIQSFSSAKARRGQAETLLLLSLAEDGGGDAALARRTLEKALAMFVELGDKSGEVRTLHRLAGFAERDGQVGKARTLLTKVRALYEELGRRSDAVKVERQLESLPEGTK
jgi:tetratricopeptide (TPR) repeat protein